MFELPGKSCMISIKSAKNVFLMLCFLLRWFTGVYKLSLTFKLWEKVGFYAKDKRISWFPCIQTYIFLFWTACVNLSYMQVVWHTQRQDNKSLQQCRYIDYTVWPLNSLLRLSITGTFSLMTRAYKAFLHLLTTQYGHSVREWSLPK